MLSEMHEKDADIEAIAGKALMDEALLLELLDGLKSSKETFRYNCFKVLITISEKHAGLLYPKWDYFVGLLDSDNSYRKMSAIQLIANLARVDKESRFEKILEKYYSLIDDKSVIVAIYAASTSGKIVNAKPNLESQITDKLLEIDKTHHPEGRKSLIKAGAIEAFDQYFEEAVNKDGIIEFAREQQNSGSPKTRKLAREFLGRFGGYNAQPGKAI